MTNAELEKKNSDLMSQVTTLQGTVQELEEELAETHRKCDEIRRVREKTLSFSFRNIMRTFDVHAA
ncbi:MAG: hypothetical protein ACRCX7_00805 [Cetobacterium sp.]